MTGKRSDEPALDASGIGRSSFSPEGPVHVAQGLAAFFAWLLEAPTNR